MSEQLTPAASSPAEVQDPFRGEQPTFVEYEKYRQSGELPERFKPADQPAESAPADAPEQTVETPEGEQPESDPESDPEDVQEPPQKGAGAEKRIKQLLAEKKELQRKLDAAAKQGVSPDSPSAPAAPQQQTAEKEPTPEETNADGTPKYKTYEEFVKAQARWEARQEIAQVMRYQAEQQALQALKVKLDESRARYADADDVIFPAAETIKNAQIPQAVKEVFSQSDLFTDLCYVVGSDPEELKKFVTLAQQNPRAALAKVFEYEKGIREELAKPGKEVEEPSGKAPEKKQTTAPPPVKPVNGGSVRGAFDVSDESVPTDVWMRKRNEQVARRK